MYRGLCQQSVIDTDGTIVTRSSDRRSATGPRARRKVPARSPVHARPGSARPAEWPPAAVRHKLSETCRCSAASVRWRQARRPRTPAPRARPTSPSGLRRSSVRAGEIAAPADGEPLPRASAADLVALRGEAVIPARAHHPPSGWAVILAAMPLRGRPHRAVSAADPACPTQSVTAEGGRFLPGTSSGM
jgi:hypothetical protein